MSQLSTLQGGKVERGKDGKGGKGLFQGHHLYPMRDLNLFLNLNLFQT